MGLPVSDDIIKKSPWVCISVDYRLSRVDSVNHYSFLYEIAPHVISLRPQIVTLNQKIFWIWLHLSCLLCLLTLVHKYYSS